MRNLRKFSVLIGLIATLMIISLVYSLPKATIDEKIDISHHLDYAEVTININSSKTLSRLEFNVSGFEKIIELAYAEAYEDIIGVGEVRNSTLIIPLKTKTQNVIVKIFYNKVFRVNESDIIVEVPAILSPIGLRSNVTLQVMYPSYQVTLLNVNASPSGGILNLNYTNVQSGAFKVIIASLDPHLTSIVRFSNFTREVIIEPGDQLLVSDNYEITGLSARKLEELAFLYPRYAKVVSVEGPLGPYPLGKPNTPFYSPTYRVYEFGDFLRVRVRLRSPPLNIGDKTSFSIKLSIPSNISENILSLNPFFSVGYLIPNYTICLLYTSPSPRDRG